MRQGRHLLATEHDWLCVLVFLDSVVSMTCSIPRFQAPFLLASRINIYTVLIMHQALPITFTVRILQFRKGRHRKIAKFAHACLHVSIHVQIQTQVASLPGLHCQPLCSSRHPPPFFLILSYFSTCSPECLAPLDLISVDPIGLFLGEDRRDKEKKKSKWKE